MLFWGISTKKSKRLKKFDSFLCVFFMCKFFCFLLAKTRRKFWQKRRKVSNTYINIRDCCRRPFQVEETVLQYFLLFGSFYLIRKNFRQTVLYRKERTVSHIDMSEWEDVKFIVLKDKHIAICIISGAIGCTLISAYIS